MPSVREKIIQAYETLAESYNALIDHKPHNAYYDRPNTLALMPEVAGKSVLDAACGPGKYAEILIERGAAVTGFDISPKMIELAQVRNPDKGTFYVHDLHQPLDRLDDSSFDVVLCALALHYLPDWNQVMQEFHRVLKPGGHLVISIEHPFFEYGFFKSKKYFETEHVHCTWKGFGAPVEVNSYRRSLQECIIPMTDNGFLIEKIVEPRPTPEFKALDPRHYEELNNFPSFICIRAIRYNQITK
ncbi:MAG: class I SAM-dependent methyltransferase [Saprospiraceae bacterium]|nr:class I SAM-dependent methyltransferase [Saprospiraceae bacterium]